MHRARPSVQTVSHSPLLLSPCLCFSVLPIAQQVEEESPWKEGSIAGGGGLGGCGGSSSISQDPFP